MTIEVKEMIIKTRVIDEITPQAHKEREVLNRALERMKSEILAECRELLMEMLTQQANR